MQKNTATLHDGRSVRLVPREQMRRATHGRTLRLPQHLQGLLAALPTPPATFDGSKGRSVSYPMLGNDQYGDCYEADALHCTQTWVVSGGRAEPQFDLQAVIREYLALSGGDNGLSDQQVFPHWKGPGFQGHRILDELTIDPRDPQAIRLGLWAFCGGSWTAALPDSWLSVRPGGVWDRGRADPNNGHAMHLSGYDGTYYHVETWGFAQAVRLTQAGLLSADPEVTVQFSLEMFDERGIAPHSGTSYDSAAALWQQLGGQQLPPSPFTPPVPTPPVPPPPTPSGRKTFSFAYDPATGAATAVTVS